MAKRRLIKIKKDKHKLADVEVNTISLMDILTTLLFFLIIISTIDKAFVLEASSLSIGNPDKDPKQVFTLSINFVNARQAEFFLGPFDKVDTRDRQNFEKFMQKYFKGSPEAGFVKVLKEKDKEELSKRLQRILVKVKKSFPNETKIVLGYSDQVFYEDLIYSIEKVRSLDQYFKPLVLEKAGGVQEKSRVLFPEVVLSEWQEGSNS